MIGNENILSHIHVSAVTKEARLLWLVLIDVHAHSSVTICQADGMCEYVNNILETGNMIHISASHYDNDTDDKGIHTSTKQYREEDQEFSG